MARREPSQTEKFRMKSLSNRARSGKKNHAADPLSVYDGQHCIGEIRDHGRGNVTAIHIDPAGWRTPLGAFPSRTASMRAIVAAAAKPGAPR